MVFGGFGLEVRGTLMTILLLRVVGTLMNCELCSAAMNETPVAHNNVLCYYYISGLLQPELYTTFLCSIMFFNSISKAQ